MIVGTGETGELAARALADSGARPVFVASRRRDRAISLARRYGGESVSFDELPQALERADMLVAATASPHLLLEAAELAEVMGLRRRAAAAADRPRGARATSTPRAPRSTASRCTTSTTSRR